MEVEMSRILTLVVVAMFIVAFQGEEPPDSAVIFALYALGVLASVVLPYVIRWLEEPTRFDWRYVVGRILASFVALIPLLADPDYVDAIRLMAPMTAFGYGYFASDIGREVQKLSVVVVKRFRK